MARRRVTAAKSANPPAPERSGTRWLLLIHQIPPKPDYLRVKIGRRLQRIGAVAIKNSVYALPQRPESYEDFQWIMREIVEAGGDAFVSEALLGDGLTDEAVRARFDAGRNEAYGAILADAKTLRKAVRVTATRRSRGAAKGTPSAGAIAFEHELAKLRRQFETVSAIDYFGASGQAEVEAALTGIRETLRRNADQVRARQARRPVNGATWVTRRGVKVDRIASAWLIRRFIDRSPRFRFVNSKAHTHTDGEIRFDMFEAEHTHEGDACTFETLVSRFVPDDAALREVAEIVHDVDCKDGKFRRDEAPGLARMIEGIVARHAKDQDRLTDGMTLFDNLRAAFADQPAR